MVKILAISDTHLNPFESNNEMIGADYLIHCGDLTNNGSLDEINAALNLLAKQMKELKIKKGIISAGNHDNILETNYGKKLVQKHIDFISKRYDIELLLTFDEVLTIKDNLTVFISPYYKRIGSGDYFGFSYSKEMTQELFKFINEVNPDILITHGPPLDILDYTEEDMFNPKENYGCPIFKEFLNSKPTNLKLCIFGHIHERGGESININSIDFINVAVKPKVISI